MSCSPVLRFRIGNVILGIAACALFGASNLSAQGEQLFKGQVIKCSCGAPDAHSAMADKGATNARCPDPCSTIKAKFLLLDTNHSAASP